MEYSKSLRFWLTVFCLGLVIWLGTLTLRAIIANEFFITGTLEYSPYITFDQERTLFQLVSAASVIVLISYTTVLASATVVLRKLPIRFKTHGYLLMAAILFYLFVPVEIFTGYLDVKFILLWETTKSILAEEGSFVYPQYSTLMRETLSHRIGALGGLPVIATLCYFSAVVIIIWQPLHRQPAAIAPSET